jgi:hypothetical protein
MHRCARRCDCSVPLAVDLHARPSGLP